MEYDWLWRTAGAVILAAALLTVAFYTRPKSKALRFLSRLLFSALALFALHRLSGGLPALNAASLAAVTALGPIGYGLVLALQVL